MMHHDAQSSIVIAHITEGFVDLALRTIGRFHMHPAHGIGRFAEGLNHKDFRNALHPRAAIRPRRTNRET